MAELAQVGGRAAFDSPGFQLGGQTRNQGFAIEFGTICPAVLEFNDVPPEKPIPLDKRAIDRVGGPPLHFLMRTPAQPDEMLEIELLTHSDSPIFFKCPSTLALNTSTSCSSAGRGRA